MDIQKIAHIGTETVLFIGMFVYFNTQIKRLRIENEELKEKIVTLTETNNKQLNNLYMILDNVKANMSTMASMNFSREQAKSQYKPQFQRGMSLNQSGVKHRKVQLNTDDESSGGFNSKSKKVKESIKMEELEDNLDAEIEDELNELEDDEQNQFKDIEDSTSSEKKKF